MKLYKERHDLSPLWEINFDGEGRKYYYDQTNQKTTSWIPPVEHTKPMVEVRVREVRRLGPLPDRRELRLDPDGRVYFVNHNTKATTWNGTILRSEPSIPEFILNGKQEPLRSGWWSETAKRYVAGTKERFWSANPSSLPSLLEEDCAAEPMVKEYDDLAAEVKYDREADGVILPTDNEEIQKWVLAAADAYVSSIRESLCFVGPDGVGCSQGNGRGGDGKKAGITTRVSPPVPTRRL